MAVHPSRVMNTHVRHVLFWILFLPVLVLVFLPMTDVPLALGQAEARMVDVKVSPSPAQQAGQSFHALFGRTGIARATTSFFGGAKTPKSASGRWIGRLWQLIVLALWRWHAWHGRLLLTISGMMVAVLVDALWAGDGRHERQRLSAARFYAFLHLAAAMAGVAVLTLLAPFALNPAITALAGLLFLWFCWLAIKSARSGS